MNKTKTGSSFAMMCCAYGAEKPLKEEIAMQGWRLAFSRPGFVTAKHDNDAELPKGIFVRSAAKSLGQARGENAADLTKSLCEKLVEHFPKAHSFDQLHVWPKDRAPIGRFDFEPGIDEVSMVVADVIADELHGTWVRGDRPNQVAQPGESVLDVVLVEPSHWFFGTHRASGWPSRWPGGVQPMQLQDPPISRAYFKAAEGIQWSGFEMQRGDLALEIGSAPGGACSRLLELGLKVIGIDPAEMDESIASHPNFRHIVARAGDLPRREYRGVKWMLVDSNVRPEQTLVTVGNIVNHRHSDVKGLLVTMKLGDYESGQKIPQWIETVQSWNPKDIRVRQLARNRCEVCFAIRF